MLCRSGIIGTRAIRPEKAFDTNIFTAMLGGFPFHEAIDSRGWWLHLLSCRKLASPPDCSNVVSPLPKTAAHIFEEAHLGVGEHVSPLAVVEQRVAVPADTGRHGHHEQLGESPAGKPIVRSQ